jgi:hypothetical protein
LDQERTWHVADRQGINVGVENLWMIRAFPVDDLSPRNFFSSRCARFATRAVVDDPFAAGFA